MKKRMQLALNMGSQTLSFALSLAINFLLTPVIVGKIGKEVYGFFGLAGNMLDYVTVITVAVNGMANRYITVEYAKGNFENANRYFTSVTLVNIVFSIALAVPAALLAAAPQRFFDVPAQHLADIRLLWAFCFAVFFVNLIFSRYDAAAFAKNRLEITAGINVTSMLLKAAMLLAAYTLLVPRISYLGAVTFVCALYTAAAKVISKRKIAPQLKFKRSLYSFRAVAELAKTGIWNSVSQLSQLLFTGLDLLIANLFIGAAGMSLLSVAKTVPTMIIGLLGTIAGAFYPIMTITYSKSDVKDFLKECRFASEMCGFICSVPIMGLDVFGKPFFTLWLPSLSQADTSQIQILSVLTLMPQMFSVYVFPLYQINTITCRVKLPALVDCGIGAANIAIVYALLKFTDLGLYAIAGVSSVLLILRILIFVPLYAAHNIHTPKRTFYPFILRGVLLNLVLLLLFGIICRFAPASSWIMLAVEAAAAGIIGYAAGFFVIFSRDERKKAAEMLLKRFKRQ